jgi:hypothetical protein
MYETCKKKMIKLKDKWNRNTHDIERKRSQQQIINKTVFIYVYFSLSDRNSSSKH